MSTRNDKRMNWKITMPANRRKWIRTEWIKYLIDLLLVIYLLLLLQLVLSVISILDLLFLLLVWAASFCRMNLHFESFASALQVHAYGLVFTLVMTHWSPQKSISIWECRSISLVSLTSFIKYLIAVMQNRTCKSSQHGNQCRTIVEVKIGNKTYCFHLDQQDPASLVSCLFSLFVAIHLVWFWAWDVPNQLYLCSIMVHYLQEGKNVRNCVFAVIYK